MKAKEEKHHEIVQLLIDAGALRTVSTLFLSVEHETPQSTSPSSFQGETKEEEPEDNKKTTNVDDKKKQKQKPNARCNCGSNKKYKKCCGSKKR